MEPTDGSLDIRGSRSGPRHRDDLPPADREGRDAEGPLHVDVAVDDIEDATDPLESSENDFRLVTKLGEDRG
jgi:hypothetical protein